MAITLAKNVEAKTTELVVKKFNFDSELEFSSELIDSALAINEKQCRKVELDKQIKTLQKEASKLTKQGLDSTDLLNEIEELKAEWVDVDAYISENESNLLTQLEAEYKDNRLAIKGIIKENLAELNEKRIQDLADIETTRSEGLEKIEETYSQYSPEELKTKDIKVQQANEINGVNIVAKRAQLKVKSDFQYGVKHTKLKEYFLHHDYVAIKNTIRAKEAGFIDRMKSAYYENWVTVDINEILTNKKTYINLLPLFLLVLMAAAFYISRPFTGYQGGFNTIMNKGVFVATVAVGAVFIYSGGSFDMSLGPASVMCATVAALMWNTTGNVFVSLLVSILLGAFLGIVNAILASVLDLPVMVMTLTMMNILNAIHSVIMSANGNKIDYAEGLPNEAWVFATFLVGFFILCWVIFNYTKMGRRNKLIGSNSKAAKFSGVNLMTAGIISFAISGIGLGIAGFLYTAYKQTGVDLKMEISSIGLNVVIAIVLGGMTTSGGPRSRISCGLIGALFVTFLDQFFVSLSTVPSMKNVLDYTNLAKGVVFLVVSFINMYSSRPKMLAR